MTDCTTFIVDPSESGMRLDVFLTHYLPQYSRTVIRNAIMHGGVQIFEEDSPGQDAPYSHGKPGFRLKPGQVIRFSIPTSVLEKLPRDRPIPENIPLDILYEDQYLAVINKQADMVVHPSRGHWSGTLVSALAFHYGEHLSSVRGSVRPGVVHRLDRDTTGAILIAKDDFIHGKLASLFEAGTVSVLRGGREANAGLNDGFIEKEYFAIVLGKPYLDRDMLDFPIGLHPRVKEKMRIVPPDAVDAKHAQTFYEVVERFGKWSTVRCVPKTGRTHQIRVHLAHIGHPVLCDRIYGGGKTISQEELRGTVPFSLSDDKPDGTILLQRQALHASRLSFTHPATGERLSIAAPLPQDMQSVLDMLR